MQSVILFVPISITMANNSGDKNDPDVLQPLPQTIQINVFQHSLLALHLCTDSSLL